MNIKLTQQKLLFIKYRRENKSDYDIVKEVVYKLCNEVIKKHNNNKKLLWDDKLIASTAYTFNSNEYDRKTVPMDFRLFSIPKEVRILGDFEFVYGRYFLINNENKNNPEFNYKLNMYL
jgi:hypothetical protein